MRLTTPQVAVLKGAAGKTYFTFRDAVQVGGNGTTLASLTKRGLLVRNDYPDRSKDWQITQDGRAELARAAGSDH